MTFKNLTMTFELGRMRTCSLPDFSALLMLFRASFRTDVLTILTGGRLKGGRRGAVGEREEVNQVKERKPCDERTRASIRKRKQRGHIGLYIVKGARSGETESIRFACAAIKGISLPASLLNPTVPTQNFHNDH